MKNRIIVNLILLILFQTPAYSGVYDFLDDSYENNFKEFCIECSKKINVEAEIVKFLEQEQVPVSLDECLDVALKNNFDIKINTETYKSSKYLHTNALAKFLPNFGYSFYSIYYRGQVLVGSALIDRFDELALSSMLVATHDLTEGGKQIFDAKTKKFEKYEQKNKLEFSKQEVLMYTAIYYWQLLQAKISIEIHLKNLNERLAQLRLTENLEDAGMGTKFDVIRQKNEVESAKRSLVEAMNDYRLKQAKLSNIMGIEVSTTLCPIENEVQILNLVDKDITLDNLYEVAAKNRKDIKAIKNKIDAMKNERRAIYTEFSPKPRALFQQQYQGTARAGLGEATVVGLYVDWFLGENLGVGTITKAKSKTCEIEAKLYELTKQLRAIKEKLLDSYYNSKLLLKRVDITKKQVDYATESALLAEMRLDAGQGILIDVIEAQSQKTDARIEYLQAVIEYNINQIELLFDEGIIDIDKIVEKYNP